MQRFTRQLDRDFVLVLLLLALGLIAYSNSFLAAFHFDDFAHIVKNDAIVDLSNIGKIYSHCSERFLTYFTLAVNYRISGLDRVSYHIFNFFVHFFAGFFLYFLLLEIWKTPAMHESDLTFPRRLAAFLAAGVFLLHPLQTQSVTYVVQRAESMAGMFYLGTLLFYVRARLSTSRYGAAGSYVVMLVFGLAAAFSKETAVTLPAMIVVFEVFFFKTSFRNLLRKRVIILALVPAAIVVSYKLGLLIKRGFYYDPGSYFTRKQYFLTQLSVFVTYVKLFFWPANQNLDWDYPVALGFLNARTLTSLILLLVLVSLAVVTYRRYRLVSLGIAGFFLTLAPTSTIIPIKDLMYEHRMYLAVAFLTMGSVQVLLQGLGKLRDFSPRLPAVVLGVTISGMLPLLACLTYARNEVWRSEISLWHDTVQKSPNKARPHINYGRALYEWGDFPDAKKHFEIANRLCSHCPSAHHNLAFMYWKEGDLQRAIALERKALELKPRYAAARYNLSEIYREMEEWQEARIQLERLLEHPKSTRYLRAYTDLLDIYLQLGLDDEAAKLVRKMAKLPGGMRWVDYYRGIASYTLKEYDQAKVYFASQKEHSKERVLSYLMLGHILYIEDDFDQAEQVFRKVLQERPWSEAGHSNLAVILERRDQFDEASEHLEKVLVSNPFSMGAAIRLTNLYDHLGSSAKRTERFRKLLGLKPDSAEYLYLKERESGNFGQTLRDYKDEFLSRDSSGSSIKAKGIIATMLGDCRLAIHLYEQYLQTPEGRKEKPRIEKEIRRLQGVMQGREPLRTPV